MASGDDNLVFLPLGGVGEIGMNLALYGFGPERARKWIMVDCGVTFAAEEHLPGIDLILPDISFIEDERDNLLAIFLTHGHEDHLGAVPDLWPRLKAPVYATPFTARLLAAKLMENRGQADISINEVPPGEALSLEPFEVEFVSMAHSIPETSAIAIKTPAGTVLHTADWKIDPDPVAGPVMDEARLRQLGDQGLRAVICDSTNALRDGTSPSEADVGRALAEVMADAKARVVVTCFASNVARIRSIALAAAENDRQVVLVGRAMHRVTGVARDCGYLDGVPEFLDDDAFGYLPRDKVVLICTGSQGEPRAALTRIAGERHPTIDLSPGDRVIYSARVIPGNDREVGRVLNALIRRGIEVITDRTHMIHVSGHPRRGELEQFYDMVRPHAVIPVHGEAAHLSAHADLVRARGIDDVIVAYNGDIVRLAPGPLEKVDDAPAGRLFKDGRVIEHEEAPTVRARRSLAYAGAIAISLTLEATGDLATDPEIVLLGLPELTEDGEAFSDLVLDAVEGAVDAFPRARRRSPSQVKDTVRRSVRSAVADAWGKKPNCEVLIHQV
ncbi:MAG: ribonuclease J [Pseudomonadota bacterium]